MSVGARLAGATLGALVLASAGPARAYPSSVVFVPSADALSLANVTLFAYVSAALAPKLATSPAWYGGEIGVLPEVPLGKSRLSLGGAELGADLLVSDLLGTPQQSPKGLLNAKVRLLSSQGAWVPAIAVGFLGYAPSDGPRSMNLVYANASERLGAHGQLGRVTLGLAGSASDFSGDAHRSDAPVFAGTWPFDPGSKLALLAGYEAPKIGPVALVAEYLGGAGELGATNLAATFTITDALYVGVGEWFGNDSHRLSTGSFLSFTSMFDARKVLHFAK